MVGPAWTQSYQACGEVISEAWSQTKLKTPAHARLKSNTNCQIHGEIMKMKHCGKTNKPGSDTIISFEGHLKLISY